MGVCGRPATAALLTSVAAIIACVFCLGQDATLFSGAYRVDQFSQVLKLVFACGFTLILLLSGNLQDIREDIKPEYFLFLTLSVSGLAMLVSCVDIITLVIALEVSAFPLYFLVAMRREREGQKSQMESAIKYIMFGVAANGVMFFGMSYLFGLTGTTSLPDLLPRLQPVIHSPLAIAGLALTFCGLYYKLAVFPFHFWTPDVYQGASNETAGLVASLPKVGAVAVLVRFVSLATPDNHTVALMLAILATGSMFYGNLIALMQKDFKRLLGFSGIAHAGYALIGFVALDQFGYTAALYYIIGYLADGAGVLRRHLQSLPRRHERLHRRPRRPAPPLALARPDPDRRRVCPGRHPSVRRFHGQAHPAVPPPWRKATSSWSSSPSSTPPSLSITTSASSAKPVFRDPGDRPAHPPRLGHTRPVRAADRRHPRPRHRPRPHPRHPFHLGSCRHWCPAASDLRRRQRHALSLSSFAE